MLKWSHYKDKSSKIQLFSLSNCFVWLLAGAGGGGAVQGNLSCPYQPGYKSKIVLLILLIVNYLNMEMYQL